MIGVFDSGVGGLSVIEPLLKKAPKTNFIYFGDTGHVPYGERSQEEIVKLSYAITEFLEKHQVQLILVACNTSSALALERIRQHIRLPIYGVIESGVRAALSYSRSGKVGVLCNLVTHQNQGYQNALAKYFKEEHSLKIKSVPCPQLVPLIEGARHLEPSTKNVVAQYLNNFEGWRCDQLILGCTHYPFIRSWIEEIWPFVKIIDPGASLAEYIFDNYQHLLNGESAQTYYVSGNNQSFVKAVEKLYPAIAKGMKAYSVKLIEGRFEKV